MSVRDERRAHPTAVAFRADPTDERHGSVNGYTNLACRCERCRAAWAASLKVKRAERNYLMACGVLQPEHGSRSTYLNYNCRCVACVVAKSEHDRQWRASHPAVAS